MFLKLSGSGLSEGFGTTFAVNGTGDDATGIACPFATRIEALEGNMVEGCIVARDAQGRRGAGLDTDNHSIIGEKTLGTFPEDLKTLAKPVGNKRRHPQVESRRLNSRQIG